MPKLLIFVPCEKIIIDAGGNASLIVLLQDIGLEVPAKTPVPREAVTPKEWAIFTAWKIATEDFGRTFKQVVQLLWPDGKEFKNGAIGFVPEDKKAVHQIQMNIVGFPVGQVGPITINMWLEDKEKKIGEVYSYIMNVTHKESQGTL
jgi:hypothetical protein